MLAFFDEEAFYCGLDSFLLESKRDERNELPGGAADYVIVWGEERDSRTNITSPAKKRINPPLSHWKSGARFSSVVYPRTAYWSTGTTFS